MSTKRRRRKKREPSPEPIKEETESEEESEEEEEIEPPVFIPKLWRLADEGKDEEIYQLLIETEKEEVEKKKLKEESGEDDEEDSEEESEEEEEEEEKEEDSEDEDEEDGEKKKKKAVVDEEKPMSLKELLSSKHPIHGYNLLMWSSSFGKNYLVRKLLSFFLNERNNSFSKKAKEEFKDSILGFENPKVVDIVEKWNHELEEMKRLELKKAKEMMEKGNKEGNDSDSEDEESEDEDEDEEGKPDFFERMQEEYPQMSGRAIQSLCQLGIYESPEELTYPLHRRTDGTIGRCLYPNGDIYIGEFQEHQKHGYGCYLYQKGGYFIGEFEKNERSCLFGFMKYPNGDIYQGSFEKDFRHGFGRFKYAPPKGSTSKGDFYYGGFCEDLKSGSGVYEFAKDGTRYEGVWGKGKFIKGLWKLQNGVLYKGEFNEERGIPKGKGTFFFPSKKMKQKGRFVTNGEEKGRGKWIVHRQENMKKQDFRMIETIENERRKEEFSIYIVTGNADCGKESVLEHFQMRWGRDYPFIYFVKRWTNRPDFCCSGNFNHHVSMKRWKKMKGEKDPEEEIKLGGENEGNDDDEEEEVIIEEEKEEEKEQKKDENMFFCEWTKDGFDYGLLSKYFNYQIRSIKGNRIFLIKVEENGVEEVYRKLKELFQKTASAVKVIQIHVDDEILTERMKKRGLNENEIQDILKQKLFSQLEVEDWIKLNNNGTLEETVDELKRIIIKE